jgi:hypothetical protein
MHHGENDDRIVFDTVEDPERKAMKHSAMGLSVDDWVDPRIVCDSVERIQDLVEEIATESRALALIPCACLLDVSPYFRTDKYGKAHSRLRISAITSAAG